MTEPQRLKDYFGPDLAHELAARLQAVYPALDAPAFTGQIIPQLAALELKGRVHLIAATLHAHLPADYPAALAVLHGILGPELPGETGMFEQGFFLMPVAAFVETYGPDQPAQFEQSMHMLSELTKRHTAEFAIRPFLLRDPERTFARLHQWASDPSSHVRRLVSEGCRPRLPWAARIPALLHDPTPIFALLEKLKHDSSVFVRKSVANNLNDITKDHPDQVLALLRRWNAASDQQGADAAAVAWITRHALRTLVKQGHPAALRLLAVEAPRVKVLRFALEPETLHLGGTLTLALELESSSDQPQELVIDYIVHLVRGNGKTQPRVFKLKTCTLPGRGRLLLTKRQNVQPVTTRRYYSGLHRVEVQVNGEILASDEFALVV